MIDWKFVWMATLIALSAYVIVCMLYSALVDIYFRAKLEYTAKVMAGLGKTLTEAGRRIGGKEQE